MKIIRKIIRNFKYVWFSKEFQAIVIDNPKKDGILFTYRLRELGFDREVFEINVKEGFYKKGDIISLGPKK